MKEAAYYEILDNKKVHCLLCPFHCKLKEGELARCLGRQNINGKLIAINYGKTTSCAMDPIEKKPLFHFYPTSQILSIAANGCNLKCSFCQNWTISQIETSTIPISPEDVVKLAIKNNSIGVAYTYSEPLMWYEFVFDTAKLMKQAGLKNVLVSNGTINDKPLENLMPYIDAYNIDLKAMDEHFYKKNCKGMLKPVLHTIEKIHEAKESILEITNLIIPTLNDSEENLKKLIDWVANLDPVIPVHFSAYHPAHQLTISPTPLSILKMAYEMAKQKLYHVYVGNAFLEGAEDTLCPKCSKVLIHRSGYWTKIIGLEGERCSYCKEKIYIRL